MRQLKALRGKLIKLYVFLSSGKLFFKLVRDHGSEPSQNIEFKSHGWHKVWLFLWSIKKVLNLPRYCLIISLELFTSVALLEKKLHKNAFHLFEVNKIQIICLWKDLKYSSFLLLTKVLLLKKLFYIAILFIES